jgi:pimeloyl-ACP methyl ester carboxylesterase
MDATQTGRAVVAGVSRGGVVAAVVAATEPDRVTGAVMLAPAFAAVAQPRLKRVGYSFTDELDVDEGWALYNQHAWRRDLPKFADFFWRQVFTEPHSTKQIEDATGWALEIDGETLAATRLGLECCDAAATRRLAERMACPVLVIHGTDDAVRGYAEGEALAGCTGGALVTLAGAGHFPHERDPVRVNLLIKQFADRIRQ